MSAPLRQALTGFSSSLRSINGDSRARTGSNHAVFAQHRVIVQMPETAWWKKIEAQLNQLTALERNWDGYGGRPVTYTCAAFAGSILQRIYFEGLPLPSLVPGGDGTIQVEWHKNNLDIELDVLDANKAVGSYFDLNNGAEEVVDFTTDFKVLAQWVEELVTDRGQLAAAAP